MFLKIGEPAAELCASFLQSGIRIQFVKPPGIYQSKNHIPKFILCPILRSIPRLVRFRSINGTEFPLEFAFLLLYLRPDILLLLPIKAHTASLVLDAVSLNHRRKRLRHSAEHPLVPVLLLGLEHLPVLHHILSRRHLSAGKYVRMAIYQLITQVVNDIGNIKLPLLIPHLGIENHVQEQISQFLADFVMVILENGIAEFISLLYGLRTQALVGLLAVPRAFNAEFVEYVQKPSESFQFLFPCIHIFLINIFAFANPVNISVNG